jgi:hypothetical protein
MLAGVVGSSGGASRVSQRYSIRVAGRLDAEGREASRGMHVRLREGMTVLVGEGDQDAVHGLELIRSLA